MSMKYWRTIGYWRMPTDKEGKKILQVNCVGFVKAWGTKVEIVVNE